ncbi:MAG: hypothetical protein OXN81_20565 [Alphaproteobacteria bacterium]|nr:hypothetical protein [Alphaproteobacteria bacterium]
MKFDGFAAMPKCFRAAALALPIALGLAAPAAAAEPTLIWTDAISIPAGQERTVPASGVFSNFGEGAVYTSVTFSTTNGLNTSDTGLHSTFLGAPSMSASSGAYLTISVLSSGELTDLDSPFTFTADVTLRNDAGDEASATLKFETYW